MKKQELAIFSRLLASIKAQWFLIFFPVFILVFVYWLLSPKQREWVKDYLIPILFFLVIAGRTLWRAIQFILKWAGKPSFLILITLNNLMILSFMIITIISYIVRSRPLQRAVGIKERAFPLFVIFLHIFGSYIIAIWTRFQFNLGLYISGLIISILGLIMDCLALWQLKKSFSIMVEVRSLVTRGIYSKIRHPVYAGELLHFLGISLLFNNIQAYGLFLFLIFLQSLRAILEEKKLIAHFPEYVNYREQTGFFFPKIRLRKILMPKRPHP